MKLDQIIGLLNAGPTKLVRTIKEPPQGWLELLQQKIIKY